MRATSPDVRAAAASACVEAVAQQLPVGQAGQGVVRRLVPVALGGGDCSSSVWRRSRLEAPR